MISLARVSRVVRSTCGGASLRSAPELCIDGSWRLSHQPVFICRFVRGAPRRLRLEWSRQARCRRGRWCPPPRLLAALTGGLHHNTGHGTSCYLLRALSARAGRLRRQQRRFPAVSLRVRYGRWYDLQFHVLGRGRRRTLALQGGCSPVGRRIAGDYGRGLARRGSLVLDEQVPDRRDDAPLGVISTVVQRAESLVDGALS